MAWFSGIEETNERRMCVARPQDVNKYEATLNYADVNDGGIWEKGYYDRCDRHLL